VRPVKIDYTGHEENYRIFLKELDVLKKNGETICDITVVKDFIFVYGAYQQQAGYRFLLPGCLQLYRE
jgi:hypothetical protein